MEMLYLRVGVSLCSCDARRITHEPLWNYWVVQLQYRYQQLDCRFKGVFYFILSEELEPQL